MTYYRVAMQEEPSATWMWTSTVLVELQAVFGFLQLHPLVKRERLRVFFSSSFEYLNAMLDRENQGLRSNSLTAEQLVTGSGRIDQSEIQRFESACDLHPYMGTELTSLLTAQLWHTQSQQLPSQERTNALERRLGAVELNGSADHDVPYHFALPLSLPQVLAWLRLMGRVQRGEIEP